MPKGKVSSFWVSYFNLWILFNEQHIFIYYVHTKQGNINVLENAITIHKNICNPSGFVYVLYLYQSYIMCCQDFW